MIDSVGAPLALMTEHWQIHSLFSCLRNQSHPSNLVSSSWFQNIVQDGVQSQLMLEPNLDLMSMWSLANHHWWDSLRCRWHRSHGHPLLATPSSSCSPFGQASYAGPLPSLRLIQRLPCSWEESSQIRTAFLDSHPRNARSTGSIVLKQRCRFKYFI